MEFKIIATGVLVTLLAGCTTNQAAKNTMTAPKAVVSAPGKALNLKKVKIPQSLTKRDNPYIGGPDLTCDSISAEVANLTKFVGPDLDTIDHLERNARTSEEFVDAALPYGGLVRFVSGASKHERRILQASRYAITRRAFLKTMGISLKCEPPASPLTLPFK